uniref:Uncharacterized protein n=1 Tax=Cannabis sativa TaxID=3483 RepID=A0A803NH74_CANSA
MLQAMEIVASEVVEATTGNRGGRGNRPICRLCGTVGHTRLKCYHRFDITFTNLPNQEASSSSTRPNNSAHARLIESPIAFDLSGAWYLVRVYALKISI